MRRPGHPQDRIQGTQSSLGLPLQRQDHAVSLPNPSTRPVLSFFLFFYWHTFCTILYKLQVYNILGFPGGSSGKEPACQCRRCKRLRLDPWVRKIPWRRARQPTKVFLLGESHGQRACRATAHRVTKSQTRLKHLSTRGNMAIVMLSPKVLSRLRIYSSH